MSIRIARERKGDLLLECARLHYLDKLNKTDIAARLQVSGTHVARLLREAEETGLVEISVRLPSDHDTLEAELRDRFGLEAVKVVEFSDDYEHLLKHLGRGGAALFEEICQIRWGARVGVGGGSPSTKWWKPSRPSRGRSSSILSRSSDVGRPWNTSIASSW